jgi:hypothetical protein
MRELGLPVLVEIVPMDRSREVPRSGDYDLYFGFPGIEDQSRNYRIENTIDEDDLRKWLLQRLRS